MNKGFTLVELIAVITILALLVIITTPAYDSISTNIKTRNYQSKKSTIKAETLSYIEKYLKDEIYNGIDNKIDESSPKKGIKCFSVNYLIRNGIVTSDSEKDEYILDERNNRQYKNTHIFLKVFYDYENLKLVALAEGEEKIINGSTISFNSKDCEADNTY